MAALLGQGPRQARRQSYQTLAEALSDALPLTLAETLAKALGVEPSVVEEAPEPESREPEADTATDDTEKPSDPSLSRHDQLFEFDVPPLPSLSEALATLNRLASPPTSSHDEEADPKAERQSSRRAMTKSRRVRKSYSDDTEQQADSDEPATISAAIVNRMHQINMTDRAWLYEAAMLHHDRSAKAKFDNRYWKGAAESVLAGE